MATLKVTAPSNSQNIASIVTIDAPLEKVFAAFITEELFSQWWCRGNKMKVHRFEPKDGGGWYIAEVSDDGREYPFMGSFHEILKNKRIVQTFEFLGLEERGHVSLERADFKTLESGATQISILSTFLSIEDRDAMVESGMEGGFRESIEALDRLLNS